MLKRIALLSAFAITTCAAAFAAGPHDGVWKINDKKSSWSDGKFPPNMSLSITLKFEGDELVYHSWNDTNKAAAAGSDFRAKTDGKVYPLAGQTRYNQVSIKPMEDGKYEVLEYKEGDVIVGAIWEFSADGKQLMRWGVGKAPDGKSKAFVEYFDKQ